MIFRSTVALGRGSAPWSRILASITAGIFIGSCCLGPSLKAEPARPASAVTGLTLNDYLRRVLQHNELLQAQMLEAEVSRSKWRASRGIFEPQLQASLTREANRRTNNVEQQAALAGQTVFDERNTIYDGGLESLIPTGGKVRLGYTLSDLVNNVNPYGSVFTTTNNFFTQQYQTFVGVTFTQPLLKNGGFTPTLVATRLAALDSAIAFQEYRRQLMLLVFQAESAYWNLYYAQEQLRFFDDSVSVAQNVLADTRQKLKTGQGAELDVMEAQSALALRQTKRNEALQSYYDALGHLQTLAGGPPPAPVQDLPVGPVLRAVDQPATTNAGLSYAESFQSAFDLNPDFLVQREKWEQNRLRLGFARNQVLPELDFKAAYGYNGLGSSPGASWTVAESQDFPSWSVALELDIPLAGNIQGRNLLRAARLGVQEADLNLRAVQTQIANALITSIQKARTWHQSVQSYQTVVGYNRTLLQTELERLRAGAVRGQQVLDAEAQLLDGRQSLANALVQYQEAVLTVGITDGTLLKQRNLDLTREELMKKTAELLSRLNAPQSEYYY